MVPRKSHKSKIKIKKFIGLFIIVFLLSFSNLKTFAAEGVTDEIKEILNNYYIENIPSDILNKDSINEIITDLNDPYTQIINKDDYNSIVNNSFSGIGVTVEMTEAGAEINSVMINSPAMYAGLKVGDIIVTADDKFLKGLSTMDAMDLLNGKSGVKIGLRILRNSESLVVNIIPGIVYYPTVYGKIIDKNIAYIHILSFGLNTLDEFIYNINTLETKFVNKYIIDLRNNPGGYIYSAVEISRYFAKDNIVAVFQTKDGKKYNYKVVPKNLIIDKPIVFLVNEYTASAAELLAASAQDYGTVTVIGKKTYGKGVAQSAFELSDGRILKATTLKLYSPKGRDISNGGVSPDINFNNVESFLAGELFSVNVSSIDSNSKVTKVVINNKSYFIDMNRITSKEYWEVYRQIIAQATSIDVSNYSGPNSNNMASMLNYPIIKYSNIPKTEYKIGDRVSFKVSSPNYNGQVQYRAMLWNENEDRYINLWYTKDFYYDKWKPKGKDVFTISFPVTKAGNYRIKVFAKRSGIANSKGMIKGMNCDSYVYELPFKVNS